MESATPLPLEGIRVLELARSLSGPYCAQTLGDFGADVIKVEQPVVGDESRGFTPPNWGSDSCYYLSSNRNKRSITLDLKHEESLPIIKDLVANTDVLIESFRGGVVEKLGIDYESMRKVNPRLIYLSISGFGRTGPESSTPAYDIVMQAASGVMSTTGEVGGDPVKVGPSIADMSSGLYSTISVMAALFARNTTGKGQYIDCSLLGSQVAILNHMATGYLATGKSATPMGAEHPSLAPYQAFPTRDKQIIIAAANDRLWFKLCVALGWEDLAANDDYSTNAKRVKHRAVLIPDISQRLAPLESAAILDLLKNAGVPCGPINSIGEALESPQALHREVMTSIDHPRIPDLKTPAFPGVLSETPATVRRYPPDLGQHTEEILAQTGRSSEEISRLSGLRVF